MNRSQRRKYAKEVQRGTIGIIEKPKSQLVPTELIGYNGKRYKRLEDYLTDHEKDTAKECGEIAAEMLYNTEVYMGVANIMIMLTAIRMTVGNLKTVQKSYQKIIDTYNEASDYVDKLGVRGCYEELAKNYGISLEFDDCDLDWIHDEGEEIYKRFRVRIGER